MADPLYALGKFRRAVDYLATGPGDVRSRLRVAFEEIAPVTPADLPEHLRPDFTWIKDRLTHRQPEWYDEKDIGRLGATLKWMKNKTGVPIAERILYIRQSLEDAYMRRD